MTCSALSTGFMPGTGVMGMLENPTAEYAEQPCMRGYHAGLTVLMIVSDSVDAATWCDEQSSLSLTGKLLGDVLRKRIRLLGTED